MARYGVVELIFGRRKALQTTRMKKPHRGAVDRAAIILLTTSNVPTTFTRTRLCRSVLCLNG